MKSLILDTSTEKSLLAEVTNSQIIWQKNLLSGPELSKSLGIEIQELISPPYDRIVLGVGPGSYTGIRVGAAMAQALSLGWNIPLYTTSSLTGFAPPAPPFARARDARSGGIFVQENFLRPKLIPREEALSLLAQFPLVTSPHPSRFPTLQNVQEAAPNPLLLSLHAQKADHLELIYS